MTHSAEIIDHLDVIIVGAGLSGIGAAHHLREKLPSKSFAILEARKAMGGTWDLFRYPGIRSDSDMFTLGYRFRPWPNAKAIADGPSIKSYVEETAREEGIDSDIRFETRLVSADFDNNSGRWTLVCETPQGEKRYTCSFLWMCSGYYRYSSGYAPEFPGSDEFAGDIIHPQVWPENYDYSGKRVVVIGSGATAVTLVPAMADKAANITMLQRSPTWMISLPGTSALAKFLGRFLPRMVAYQLMRLQRILLQLFVFRMARARPKAAGKKLLDEARKMLPEGYDVEKHFHPRYNPWEQRLCLVPDEDFFAAIRSGRASVETGDIDQFVKDGVRLKDGRVLPADLIITATGLHLELLGGAAVSVDGKLVDIGKTFTYRGFGFSGVPNLVSVFGYLNASWTLRADLIADYVTRLLKLMDEKGCDIATPVNDDPAMPAQPFADFTSGYLVRAIDRLPKQGRAPWVYTSNFARDFFELRHGKIDDGVLRFSKSAKAKTAVDPERIAAE
ncbi:MAG: NAD(P)/FAD-dependent oxidoreductase [Parvularculaceae bacterium]